MPAVRRILIVGAGMSGMTAGIAPKLAGFDCEIVELRQALSEPGTGITLQGPALRALRRVGILDECVKGGFPQSFFKTCDADGNVTGTVELPNLLGLPYPATIGTLRQSVHEVMATKLSDLGVSVRLGTTIRAMTQAPDAVEVLFSDGGYGQFDLVVGADGSRSNVRTLTFGSGVKPYYTGQMNWRAIVSKPAEVKGRYSYLVQPSNPALIPSLKTRCTFTYFKISLSVRGGPTRNCRGS